MRLTTGVYQEPCPSPSWSCMEMGKTPPKPSPDCAIGPSFQTPGKGAMVSLSAEAMTSFQF